MSATAPSMSVLLIELPSSGEPLARSIQAFRVFLRAPPMSRAMSASTAAGTGGAVGGRRVLSASRCASSPSRP
eukprot:2976149-Pyramimonas_sp.AAC.1